MAVYLYKWLCGVFILLSFDYSGKTSSLVSGIHPLYVSVTEISHNAKDKTVEISCKIFTNDFETTLQKFAHRKVDLSDLKNKQTADKYISEYIQKNLKLKLDGRMVDLSFVGSEKETDATWSYFQINNIPKVKKIEMVNTILYDVFAQEINIIHVTIGGIRKSTKLSNPEANASFEF